MTEPLPTQPARTAEPEAKPRGRPIIEFEAIMHFMVAQPHATLLEGARFFNVSPAWFAAIINSDLFIARYQEFVEGLKERFALPTLGDRIKGVTALAVEKLGTVLEKSSNEDTIVKAADTLLKAQRGPSTVNVGQVNTQVNYTLDPRLDAIQAARRNALEAARGHALPVSSVVDVTPGVERLDPPQTVVFDERQAREEEGRRTMALLDDANG